MLKRNVRVVAGRFKGHRLKVIDQKALRPTSGRIRETLFNWIGTDIVGMRVLDLFAGSGALGFEALSRGSATVTFIEKKKRVAAQIKETCNKLDVPAEEARVVCTNSLRWLKHNNQIWDLVFLDPPFGETEFYTKLLKQLPMHVSSNGLIYLEHSKRVDINMAPYRIWKQATVGEVTFALLALDSGSTDE